MYSFGSGQIGAWAKQAVAQAVEAGIVGGYDDGSFRSNAQITRAEMASMIARALKLQLNANALTGFADDTEIPQWTKGAVEAIREFGIVDVRGGNVLFRTIQRLVQKQRRCCFECWSTDK